MSINMIIIYIRYISDFGNKICRDRDKEIWKINEDLYGPEDSEKFQGPI